jgi:hypothetical protein
MALVLRGVGALRPSRNDIWYVLVQWRQKSKAIPFVS